MFDQQRAIERFITSHGGRVILPYYTDDGPFGMREPEFTTPDGAVRPISEFNPSLFRNDAVAIDRTTDERTQDLQTTRSTEIRGITDSLANINPFIEDGPIRVTTPTFRRPRTTQARNLASGRVAPVRGNTVQARNRSIYKLRGVLSSIIPLIPSDVYSDDFTQADVQALIDSVSTALDRKRKHDFICESCLKSINNGKSAKSTAHNHSGRSCCKCGSAGPTVFRVHKDRLARLEAQSQS